jgi:AbrB family looped-hinge helix DNA binding protein
VLETAILPHWTRATNYCGGKLTAETKERKGKSRSPYFHFIMSFTNGINHGIMPSMATRISIDKAGRVVLPKALREKMRVEAGDDLLAEAEGDRITLRPIRQEALLKKELGIWVYQGESSSLSIPELIAAEREKRVREFLD